MLEQKKEEERERKEKLRDISDKRDKIKNYKFDVIKKHVGRER